MLNTHMSRAEASVLDTAVRAVAPGVKIDWQCCDREYEGMVIERIVLHCKQDFEFKGQTLTARYDPTMGATAEQVIAGLKAAQKIQKDRAVSSARGRRAMRGVQNS